ncbi:hypothetical protein ACFPM3_06145 [Streptomyces coeruleoprunus]|uniref:DUF1877 family protein n=1 Tax=Streptomyces coeruleoprunus TaxID=285563 RepID=A0ABV9X9E3_9ACTN
MGNLYDYFSAPDDDAARSAFDDGPRAAGFPTYLTKGIDAYVQLGAAEGLLRAEPYSDVTAHPRFGHLLSDPEDEARWLTTLTDELRDALAAATPQRLGAVAVPWSQIEEFQGQAAPEALAEYLQGLASLARHAQASGHRLYCLMSL